MFAVVIFGGIVCVFAILVERLGGNITQVPINLTNPYVFLVFVCQSVS